MEIYSWGKIIRKDYRISTAPCVTSAK